MLITSFELLLTVGMRRTMMIQGIHFSGGVTLTPASGLFNRPAHLRSLYSRKQCICTPDQPSIALGQTKAIICQHPDLNAQCLEYYVNGKTLGRDSPQNSSQKNDSLKTSLLRNSLASSSTGNRPIKNLMAGNHPLRGTSWLTTALYSKCPKKETSHV